MAVDAATKKEYNGIIAEKKHELDGLDKQIKDLDKRFKNSERLGPFYRLAKCQRYIEVCQVNLDMNKASMQLMGVHNNRYLDAGKGTISKIFTDMESLYTNVVDDSLDHNREQLNTMHPFNPRKKLNFYKYLKKCIDQLKDGYGVNTKWKWWFPDAYSRAAILGKNMIDYREMQAIKHPNEEFFSDRREFLEVIKQDLFACSKEQNNKFELSTKNTDTLMYAVRLLEALKRITGVMGDSEMGKKAKSGIDVYRARLEAEESNKKKKR